MLSSGPRHLRKSPLCPDSRHCFLFWGKKSFASRKSFQRRACTAVLHLRSADPFPTPTFLFLVLNPRASVRGPTAPIRVSNIAVSVSFVRKCEGYSCVLYIS